MIFPPKKVDPAGFDSSEIDWEDYLDSVDEDVITHFEIATDPRKSLKQRVTNFLKGENKLGRRVGAVADIAMIFLPSGVRTGREAVKQIITKQEKPMSVLKDKPWYQSKTIWSAILIVITGILQAAGVDLGANPAAVETAYQVIYTVAGSFGLYGLRAAIAEKSEKIEGDPARS